VEIRLGARTGIYLLAAYPPGSHRRADGTPLRLALCARHFLPQNKELDRVQIKERFELALQSLSVVSGMNLIEKQLYWSPKYKQCSAFAISTFNLSRSTSRTACIPMTPTG